VLVLEAIMVTWFTKTFAPEAKGHGVPEVMNAVYYNDGKIVVGTCRVMHPGPLR